MKKLLIFLAIFVPTIALLYFSLQRDPRDLPSVILEKKASAFELTSLDGKKISLEMARGKPLILNFWSTWCGPCAAEYNLLKQAYERLSPQGVAFYSILYEDTPENAKKFITQYGPGVPILLDPGLKTAIDYGVSGVPETFFIDAQGRVRYKHAGILSSEIIMGQLDQLFSKNAGGTP
ncbi:MAG: TlpA family protein disulfide reductase [Deltaproteobacteria bacterium]|nr:TlpA family protein disulfide reductase [Deltaproteobacteria bacterium]